MMLSRSVVGKAAWRWDTISEEPACLTSFLTINQSLVEPGYIPGNPCGYFHRLYGVHYLA